MRFQQQSLEFMSVTKHSFVFSEHLLTQLQHLSFSSNTWLHLLFRIKSFLGMHPTIWCNVTLPLFICLGSSDYTYPWNTGSVSDYWAILELVNREILDTFTTSRIWPWLWIFTWQWPIDHKGEFKIVIWQLLNVKIPVLLKVSFSVLKNWGSTERLW